MSQLTHEEKDVYAKYLSFSARSGGWFLLVMSLLVVAIIAWSIYRVTQGSFDLDESIIGGLTTLFLAFFLPAFWLMRRKSVIRSQLDGELLEGTAEIISATGPTDTGWHVQLRIMTPYGQEKEGIITGYGPPPWSIGETIDLYFLPDEIHFFPKRLTFNAQMGEIPTLDMKDRRKRWSTFFLVLIGLLLAFGVIIGILTSING